MSTPGQDGPERAARAADEDPAATADGPDGRRLAGGLPLSGTSASAPAVTGRLAEAPGPRPASLSHARNPASAAGGTGAPVKDPRSVGETKQFQGLWPAGESSGRADGSGPVQDSWLIEDGQVRGLEHHLARFSAGVRALRTHLTDPTDDELTAFLASLPARFPRRGRWFPRIVCDWDADERLRWELRPAPEVARGGLSLWSAPGVDPRRRPEIKGPDLTLLGRLRARAQEHGADEAVLLDAEGCVLEGAYSALVWWRKDARGRFYLGAPAGPVLPSVTRALVEGFAAEDGIPVVRERVRPADLQGAEAWCMSALRGLQTVTCWVAGAGTGEDASNRSRPATLAADLSGRLARWQARLDALARRPEHAAGHHRTR